MAIVKEHFGDIAQILKDAGICRPMIVCGKNVGARLPEDCRSALPENAVWFNGFSPNPLYEDVMAGVEVFLRHGCDGLISIGGGSAIDVAKCIKLYCKMPAGVLCLEQPLSDTGIFHLAIPTTAGTGSEATHYAVIYYGGIKQSVHHASILPQAVILEPKLLETLPTYQRKATALDALCQAIESLWSVSSTEESICLAEKAISILLPVIPRYVSGDNSVIADMLIGSNLAGQAINVTKTTAPHAMCYKLTTLYGLSHGHSVALCMQGAWKHIISNIDICQDPRGQAVLEQALDRLSRLFGKETRMEAAEAFCDLFRWMELEVPAPTAEELHQIVEGVHTNRLGNHPVKLDAASLEGIYRRVLHCDGI